MKNKSFAASRMLATSFVTTFVVCLRERLPDELEFNEEINESTGDILTSVLIWSSN